MNDTTPMPGTLEEFLNLQTRLLASGRLRRAFRQNPLATCRSLGISVESAAGLPVLDMDDIEAQARSLLDKRWHEVRRLLALPEKDQPLNFRKLFLEYSESCWPEGHHRHERDAIAFADSLRRRGLRPPGEWRVNLLRFRLGHKRVSVHWVRSLPVRSRLRAGLQILHRRKAGIAQFFLHLAG